MSFLKPLTPDEYRKKYPRCATCIHAIPSSHPNSDYIRCSVRDIWKVKTTLRLFCRVYKPRLFD